MTRFEANVGEHFSNDAMATLAPCMARKSRHDAIRSSLSAQGILVRSDLVLVDRSGTSTLRGKLDLLSDGFADLMATSEADPISLLRGTVSAAGAGQLRVEDYGHISPSLEILRP